MVFFLGNFLLTSAFCPSVHAQAGDKVVLQFALDDAQLHLSQVILVCQRVKLPDLDAVLFVLLKFAILDEIVGELEGQSLAPLDDGGGGADGQTGRALLLLFLLQLQSQLPVCCLHLLEFLLVLRAVALHEVRGQGEAL